MTKSRQLAIMGGEKENNNNAPAWPIFDDADVKRVADVVASGKWSWIGPEEVAFSKEYAEFIGTKYCACMSNGTVTLQCGLQAVGVVPGDDVIVPGLTWVATAQAAMDIGANVVLVDIDPETYCIDPKAIEAAITDKTKAIIPVHLYGCMCDMDAIMAIAQKYDLKVVEDVAHQQGSRWRGQNAGSIGDVGSYSFQQSKILTSGEGGAITCNDPEVYKVAFALKQVGHTPANPEEDPFGGLTPGNHYGHNYRITEMQAAILRGGLSRLEEQNQLREKNAARIAERLLEIDGPLRAAKRDERVTTQAYYAMTMHFDSEKADGVTRGQFLQACGAEGAGFGTTYPPVYRSPLLNLYDNTSPIPFRDQNVVQNYKELKLPVVERVVGEEGVVIGQQHLLGTEEYTESFINAIEKVSKNLDYVKEYFQTQE